MQSSQRIFLRPTSEADIAFVAAAETHAENAKYLLTWSIDAHLSALSDGDLAHLIIERADSGRSIGFIILAGIKNNHDSIEFRRIVITEKGRGFGQEAILLVKKYAFSKLGAHRLWLDVKVNNVRARYIYEKQGFHVEGTLRDCIKTDGYYESLVVMSILRHEFINDEL